MTSPLLRAVGDARQRAIRTAVQGLALDVATAVVLLLVTQTTDIRWTWAYWAGLGALVAKTAVQAAVAYAARRVLPPKPLPPV